MQHPEDAPVSPSETAGFQTMDQIAEYRSGSTIECLLCGKHFLALATHLIAMHEIDPAEYRRRFGIPATLSLTSGKTRLRMYEASLRNTNAIEGLRRFREEFGHPPVASGPHPGYVPASLKVRAAAFIGEPNVTIACSDCGADVVVRQRYASRPARCLNCIGPAARKGRISYYRNKWLSRKTRLAYEDLSRYKTPFQTREEVDEYLSGETIDCLVCGRRLQRLNMHLKHAHEMTSDEYRVEFGIPYMRPLFSAPALHAQKIGQPAYNIARFTAMVHTQKIDPEKRKHKRQSAAPCNRKLRSALGKSSAARLSKTVPVTCPKCGDEFETSYGHACQQPLLCLKCASRGNRQSRLRRKILEAEGPQGPPAHYDVPFQTMEQVDAYLFGDKIQCLVCGERMQSLGRHLLKKHEMQADDYRIQFGIPFKRALQTAETTARKSAALTPEKIERMRLASERNAAKGALAKPPGRHRPLSAAVLDLRRKLLVNGRRVARETVPVPCSKCGATFDAFRLHTGRTAFCPNCSPYKRRKLRQAQPDLEPILQPAA